MANMEPVPDSNIPNATAESQLLPPTHPDEDLALVRAGKHDAHEIVQKAFFKAHQKLHQFREKSRFSTLLIRIFVNESLMKVRKLRRAQRVAGQGFGTRKRECALWDDQLGAEY